MPYVAINDFRLGMDSRKPRVTGEPGALFTLSNAHITRGGGIQRAKKFVSKFTLPQTTAETAASGSFSVTGGTTGNGSLTSLKINGIEVLGAAVVFITDNTTTAAAIAAQITAFTSEPNYTATSTGAAVTITLEAGHGACVNGFAFAGTITGDMAVGDPIPFVAETVLALRFEGNDGDTTTVDESGSAHSVTFAGDVEIDTGLKQNGSSSVRLTTSFGANEISVPDSADWDFGSGDFCVEGYMNIIFSPTSTRKYTVSSQWEEATGKRGWEVNYNNLNFLLEFYWSTTGADTNVLTTSLTLTPGTFKHLAISKEGTSLRFFADGILLSTQTHSATIFNSTAPLRVAASARAGLNQFLGNLDDVRITKGEARYTANFTPPASIVGGAELNSVVLAGGVDSVEETFHLHQQGDNLFVFGGFTEPAGVPAGVTYQRLAHKDDPNGTQIDEILDTENFDGKIYAIAKFTDGITYHYYDGARVTAWDNIATTIASNNDVADRLKTIIDLDPDFDATVATDTVTIEAAVAGTGFTIAAETENLSVTNDQDITLVNTVANVSSGSEVLATGTVTVTGGAVTGSSTSRVVITDGTVNTPAVGSVELTAGSDGSITSLTTGGTELLGSTVVFNTDLTTTASDIKDEINANTTGGLAHGYSALSAVAVITVTAPVADGADNNGDTWADSTTSTLVVGNQVAMASGVTNAVLDITVNGVSVINSVRVNSAGPGGTKSAVVAAINAFTSSPNYTATLQFGTEGEPDIIAIAGGTVTDEGFPVTVTTIGDVTLTSATTLIGSVENELTGLSVDGVSVITTKVTYATSDSVTAAAIATEITNTTSSPNYTAAAVGNIVTITAIAGTGAGPNGFVVSGVVTGTFVADTINMSGGAAAASAVKEKWTAQIIGTFEEQDVFTITLDGKDFTVQAGSVSIGTTAVTLKKKIYSTADSLGYFCGINHATAWVQAPDGSNPAEIGAGFINFSNQDSGSETLTALGVFRGDLAVFADGVIQIEFVDVDETLNSQLHTIKNTGTISPRSVIQFGNSDLFYLDELSGIRSLRAQDSSSSPESSDVGTPIDSNVLAWIANGVCAADLLNAVGTIAEEGRFWLAIGSRIYVFSFFKQAKISAWSYYSPEFVATAFARVRKKIYVRDKGNTIYLYGGDDGVTYPAANETPATVDLHFLDLNKPANKKTLNAFDFAAVNTWDCNILTNPNDETVMSGTFTLSGITYPEGRVGGLALQSSHFAPRLVCNRAGNAELHSLAVHYDLDEAD